MDRARYAGCPTLVLAVTALGFVGGVDAASAQGSPLFLRVSGGASLTTGGFGQPVAPGSGVEGGASFGAHFDYRAGSARRSGVYLGFSQHRFSCAEDGCPGDGGFVHTGWDVGARIGVTSTAVRPWIRLGAVFARVEGDFAVEGGLERKVSDLSAGAEAGLGVAIPVEGRLSVEPAARYVWMDTRFPGEGLLRMRYVVVELGIVVNF